MKKPKSGIGSDTTPGEPPRRFRSQRQAAAYFGISKREEVRARRVSNIPNDLFEKLIESDPPPTVAQLAKIGTRLAPGGRPRKTKALVAEAIALVQHMTPEEVDAFLSALVELGVFR